MELNKPTAQEIAKANAAITDALLDEMRASGFGPQVDALRVLKAAAMQDANKLALAEEKVTELKSAIRHVIEKFGDQSRYLPLGKRIPDEQYGIDRLKRVIRD